MKNRLISILRWSEQYTKTDMVYFASGAFWSNLNGVVVSLLAFVGSVFFARYLTKDAYGMYQYVLSIAGLIGSLTLNQMNTAVVRAVARGHEGEFKRSVRVQLIAGIIPFVAGMGVSVWYFLHGNMLLGIAFICVAIFLPLGNAFNTWVCYVGGKKLFRVGTYYGLANNTLTYGAILFALFFTKQVIWVIFANFLFQFVSNFIMYKLVIRNLPPNNELDNETIKYGTHLSLMAIPGTFSGQLDSLLVFHFAGAASLAVYSFATIIPEKLSGMLKFIPNLVIPKLASKDEAHMKLFLGKKLWVLAILLAVTAAAYAAAAPWLFHTFFPAYSDSIRFTQFYSLTFFSIIAAVVQTTLMSQRKTRELYTLSFATPVIRIVLMAVLMYYFAIWGLLWAQIISNFTTLGLQLALVYWPSKQAA